MPKATIEKPDGTNIIVDGTPEQVARILQLVEDSSMEAESRPRRAPRKEKSKTTIKGLILELKREGFFKEKRSLSEVKAELASRGHIYSSASLSPKLLALVLDDKELWRVKEGGSWVYVHRN